MTEPDFDFHDDESEYKSKTQIKQEMLALQKLGQELVNLGEAALKKMPMDDELEDAVMLARRINRKKDGFRRQLQFIGKLLRTRDVEPIEIALNELRNTHQRANQQFHKLEKTRDDLIARGDDAINELLGENPDLDRQKLRQLVRQANKEKQQNKPPKASREIFQYIKESTAG